MLVCGCVGVVRGSGHESIVPYQAFECKDGLMYMVGAGNDKQVRPGRHYDNTAAGWLAALIGRGAIKESGCR